jgi:hypothetical protein
MASAAALAAALERAQLRIYDSIRTLIGDDQELNEKFQALKDVLEYPAQPQIAQTDQLNILADILDTLAARNSAPQAPAPRKETAPESGKGSAGPEHSARPASTSPADAGRAPEPTKGKPEAKPEAKPKGAKE